MSLIERCPSADYPNEYAEPHTSISALKVRNLGFSVLNE